MKRVLYILMGAVIFGAGVFVGLHEPQPAQANISPAAITMAVQASQGQMDILTDITVDKSEDVMRELARAVDTEAQRLVTARKAVHDSRARLAALQTKAAYTPIYEAIDAALIADPTDEDWLRVDRIRDRAFVHGTAVFQETAPWATAMPLP